MALHRPRILLVLALLLPGLLPAAATAADYQQASVAYRQGDMQAALAAFRELADQGVIAAMENLAYMHTNGEGVPASLVEAARWLTRAAEAGSAPARAALGAMYFHGEGVEADPVIAYAWFSLAAYGDQPLAIAYLYKVAEQLTPEDIDRARVLARQMHERFGLAEQQPVDDGRS